MNIGIIDADLLDGGTRHPNLVLMKISGYMKLQGHRVELLENYNTIDHYDKVYISKVFNFTNVPVDLSEYSNVIKGGTGFYEDGGESLPCEIEHHMPDYNLYNNFIEKEIKRGIKPNRFKDYMDYSIGFTTRGCFRKCKFCVNKKYNKVQFHSHIKEFFDPSRKYIYLWDDNILGYSKWEEVFDELESTGRYFQFRQGMDIRLMTDKKAERLSKMKYKGDYIFAFDHIKDKELIERKLELWKKYCSKTTKLYVLVAFESQDEIDITNAFERISILMKHKCLPYIMRYSDYENSKYRGTYINLARWCNQPSLFKKKSYREFCEMNGLNSSTYRYMLEFEKDHPEIAVKYYDLKYEKLNMYNNKITNK